MGFLCIKAELFKGDSKCVSIYIAAHTKKNGVEDNFLGLQALTKNLVLYSRGI